MEEGVPSFGLCPGIRFVTTRVASIGKSFDIDQLTTHYCGSFPYGHDDQRFRLSLVKNARALPWLPDRCIAWWSFAEVGDVNHKWRRPHHSKNLLVVRPVCKTVRASHESLSGMTVSGIDNHFFSNYSFTLTTLLSFTSPTSGWNRVFSTITSSIEKSMTSSSVNEPSKSHFRRVCWTNLLVYLLDNLTEINFLTTFRHYYYAKLIFLKSLLGVHFIPEKIPWLSLTNYSLFPDQMSHTISSSSDN